MPTWREDAQRLSKLGEDVEPCQPHKRQKQLGQLLLLQVKVSQLEQLLPLQPRAKHPATLQQSFRAVTRSVNSEIVSGSRSAERAVVTSSSGTSTHARWTQARLLLQASFQFQVQQQQRTNRLRSLAQTWARNAPLERAVMWITTALQSRRALVPWQAGVRRDRG